MQPQVSLFASAVRPNLWLMLSQSFRGTSCNLEVVFVGNNMDKVLGADLAYDEQTVHPVLGNISITYKIMKVGNIKPAQCYEIARRHCTGETVVWMADDCEFPNDVVGKAYKYWKSQNNEKLILSIQTKESGYQNLDGKLFNMNIHRFFGGNPYTPLMAPLGMMSKEFLDKLGGYDVRYVSGQGENDIVMRALTQGATVEIFGDENCYIDIDHLSKSILTGECTNDSDFRERPFAKGYPKDREVLEKSWVIYNDKKQAIGISKKQLDEFQPYPAEIPLDHSLSNKGIWE